MPSVTVTHVRNVNEDVKTVNIRDTKSWIPFLLWKVNAARRKGIPLKEKEREIEIEKERERERMKRERERKRMKRERERERREREREREREK
jgi:hypothetical protein